MSDHQREVADKLVMESVVNGKLDLILLKRKTWEHAGQCMEKDNSFNKVISNHDIRQFYMDQYTIATREVLGIIPEKDWDHSSSDTFTAMVQTVVKKLEGTQDYKPHNGLKCTKHPEHYDPKKSLLEQGYEFVDPKFQKLVVVDHNHETPAQHGLNTPHKPAAAHKPAPHRH